MGEAPRRARRRSRIPAGPLERLARIGWMAGEAALGGLVEKARRAGGAEPRPGSALLTAASAARLARRLSRLRGAAMKLGQLLSLEGDDLFPPEVARALATLRADAEAMPDAQLRRVLARNLGKGWRDRFLEFDFEPMAAASIGQVHAAVARDGRRLAVKIQYPGVAKSIESDVDNLAAALGLARLLPVELDLSGAIAEAKAQLRREADYLAEAESLGRYRALVADEPDLVVPRAHPDLTTRRVLAMDRIEGLPLEDLCGAGRPQELRDRTAALLYRLLFREIFEFRFVQTDPNFANYLWLPRERRVGLIDFGATREVPEALARGYAALLRSAIAGDRAALRRAALEIDYLRPDERADRAEGLLDLMLVAAEPLARPGTYDFGRSDLPLRLRDGALELSLRRGLLRPPPPEAIFLHRKLAGVFLLCARLRARLDLRALVAPWLGA
jgi:predicted unusual protein kinase regulating ubiquinone biosynthesis (AarF/ABC1/UbiB family)